MTKPFQRAIAAALEQLGPEATADQVAAHLQQHGIELSRRAVAQAVGRLRREAAQAAREQAKRPPATKTHHRPQQRKTPRQS